MKFFLSFFITIAISYTFSQSNSYEFGIYIHDSNYLIYRSYDQDFNLVSEDTLQRSVDQPGFNQNGEFFVYTEYNKYVENKLAESYIYFKDELKLTTNQEIDEYQCISSHSNDVILLNSPSDNERFKNFIAFKSSGKQIIEDQLKGSESKLPNFYFIANEFKPRSQNNNLYFNYIIYNPQSADQKKVDSFEGSDFNEIKHIWSFYPNRTVWKSDSELTYLAYIRLENGRTIHRIYLYNIKSNQKIIWKEFELPYLRKNLDFRYVIVNDNTIIMSYSNSIFEIDGTNNVKNLGEIEGDISGISKK